MKFVIASDLHGAAPPSALWWSASTGKRPTACSCSATCSITARATTSPEGYAPKEVLAALNGIAERIVAVRGNCDAEVDQMVLDFPCLSDFSQVWADGHLLHLSHGHLAGNSPDRPPALPQGSALLTGHTHIKRLELVDGVMFVNPGSTSIPKDGCASYAVYDNGTFALKKLDGKTLLEAGWE